MTTDIQAADEFLELLRRGDIESHLTRLMVESVKLNLEWNRYTEFINRLQGNMDSYMNEKDLKTREKIAGGIVRNVLSLRLGGILLNNPNTARIISQERDFYKAQAEAFIRILDDVKKQRDDLLAQLTKYQNEPKPKKETYG